MNARVAASEMRARESSSGPADAARAELGEEECDGGLGHVDGGRAEYPL